MRALLLVTIATFSFTFTPRAEDWPQFRGPGGSGISESANPPVGFGTASNLVWKVSVPSGYSSPVVTGDRVFLTALNDGRLETLAIHRDDGRVLWRQRALPDNQIVSHDSAGPSPASPTPVTDGKFIYVFFGAFGVIAYDLDGKEQWRHALAKPDVSAASSPILVNDKLIIRCDTEKGAFVEARDKKTGRQLWIGANMEFGQGFSTPFHWVHGKDEELIVPGTKWLTSYNPLTGAENWRYAGTADVTTSSPASGENLIFSVVSRAGGESKEDDNLFSPSRVDFGQFTKQERTRDEGTILAIHPGRKGDISTTCLAWKSVRGVPDASSPIFYKGRLFTIKAEGLVSAFDGKTGAPIYQNERINTPGSYCASLVAAADRIYCASEKGVVTIIHATADRLSILAQNDCGERIIATPALIERTILVRTEKSLYSFGVR